MLIVDDDALVLDAVAKALDRYLDCVVDSFAEGAAAIASAQKVTYGAAVLDVQMPSMNGVQLALELRKLQPSLTIFFLTGSASEVTPQEMAKVAPRAVLPKPVEPRVLADAVRSALDGDQTA